MILSIPLRKTNRIPDIPVIIMVLLNLFTRSIIAMLFLGLSTCLERKIWADIEHGVLIEQTGIMYTHYGNLYIPMTLSLPRNLSTSLKYSDDHSSHCNYSSVIEEKITNIHMILDTLLPGKFNAINQHSSLESRYKRFLPWLAFGLGSLGLGAWNRYDITSIKNKIEDIKENVEHMSNKINTLVDYDNTLIKDVNRVHHIVQDHTTMINNLLEKADCTEKYLIKLLSLSSQWVDFAPHEFMRAMDFALQGKITPDLISFNNVLNIIKNTPDIINTPYSTEPLLFYNLGEFLFVKLLDNPRTIVGLIVLPHITLSSIGYTYNVYTVPWVVNNTLFQMELDNTVATTPGEPDFWIPYSIECRKESFYTICPQDTTRLKTSRCITDIVNSNTTDSCYIRDVTDKKSPSQMIVQTRSGLLIGPINSSIIIVGRDGVIPVTSKKVIIEKTTFLTPSDGGSALINNNIFTIGIHHDIVNLSILNIHINDHTLTNRTQRYDNSLEDLSNIEFKAGYVSHHHLWPPIIILFILSTVAIYIIHTLWKRNILSFKALTKINYRLDRVISSKKDESSLMRCSDPERE